MRPLTSAFLEEANAGPWAVSCRPFFLRQMAQQSQEERRPLESRRGFQQPLHVHRLPTMRREKSRPLGRAEFEWRANLAELFSSCALHHPQKSGRGKVQNPALKMRTRGEIFGESCYFFGAKIDEQTLGENHDSPGAAVELGK